MKAKIVPFIAVAALLAAGGAWWWHQEREQPPSDALRLHGNVDIRQVELAFNASGRIEQVLVHEGDRVAQGQLLAVLDKRRLERAGGPGPVV